MTTRNKIATALALCVFATLAGTSELSAQEIAIEPLFSDAPGDLSGKRAMRGIG